MIFRQYQKYQQKKQREQYNQGRLPQDNRRQQQPQNNRGSERRDYSQQAPQDGRYYKGSNDNYQRQQPQKPTPPKKTPPVLSEDEKNFNLKEEEFMLDPSTKADYKQEMEAIEKNAQMSHEELTDDQLSLGNNPMSENKSTNNPIDRNDEDDDGFNIRDLFLKPEDDAEADA